MGLLNSDVVPFVGGEYTIDQSLRFNSPDSAYLSRTPASAGNRKTWTWSGWVKRGNLGITSVPLLSSYSGYIDFDLFRFNSDGLQLYLISSVIDYSEETDAIFRDPAAWYHIVLSVDTTQASAANRIRIFVNGAQQTTTQTYGQVPQNYSTYVNSTNAHNIGRNLDPQ